jgi:hypothetical protein
VQDVWSPNGPQQDTPPTPLPPSLPGRQSRRDGSLTMMTGETGFEGPVILRLTDAGRPLIEPHDVGHGAFAGWCWSAPVCFSLRSDLRSYGGSPGPYVMTTAGVRVAPKHATFPLTIDLCRSLLCTVRSSPLSSARAGGLVVLARTSSADQRQRRRHESLTGD